MHEPGNKHGYQWHLVQSLCGSYAKPGVIYLWIKAQGLGQGCTRPAELGRAPGRPSPRACGPRAGSTLLCVASSEQANSHSSDASYTLPMDQLFNLDFQFKSVFNLEIQPKFAIQLGIPISMGINLGECIMANRDMISYY